MASNDKIISLLKGCFQQAINTLSANYQGSSLTDIFITVDKESGEVAFYDDEDNRIKTIVIERWVGIGDNLSDTEVTSMLRHITEELDGNDAFMSLDLYKPFSVNYADDNMIVIEELLTIADDSTIHIDNDLLAKFDKEFDEFLDKLLKE